jgi:hypothetical protein
MNSVRAHTTIGLRKTTKKQLDGKRAPGQCYDGFLCQLMDLWDASNESKRPRKKIREAKQEVPR